MSIKNPKEEWKGTQVNSSFRNVALD